MRRALALGLLAIVSFAAGASASEVDLHLGEDLALGDATLALGHLDPGHAQLSDVHAVDVDSLELPEGTLYVCEFHEGSQDEVPPIPTLQERCRGEDTYEDPRLELGDRTWLVLAGELTLQDAPSASTTLIAAETGTDRLRLASITAGPMGLDIEQQAAFRPQSTASQIRVETDDEEQTYNGTDWVFYLEASGSAELDAAGVHAIVPGSASLTLTPAGTGPMRDALEPRTLLDLQAAAVGPDEREPVANATRLLGEKTRLPPLVDGSLLGYLNGSIGQRSFDPGQVSLVGVSHLEGQVEDGNLTGEASVRFSNTEAGVAPGLDEPTSVPWLGIVVLWLLAGLSIASGPAAAIPNLRHRSLSVGSFLLALVGWDIVFASALGTSALSTTIGEAGLGVVLALGAFEVIAFGLAWILLAAPFVVIARRWLIDRLAVHAASVATFLLLGYAFLRPGTFVAIGRLVAQV